MSANIFESIRLLMYVILLWSKRARVKGQIHLGIRICRSHNGFESGRVIYDKQGGIPSAIDLEHCEPAIVFTVTKKGQTPKTLQMISLDSPGGNISERFQGVETIPLRLQWSSRHLWFTPFEDATFLSFESRRTNDRPHKVRGTLEFDDGSKKKTRNKLTPKDLSDFADSWRRKLEGVS